MPTTSPRLMFADLNTLPPREQREDQLSDADVARILAEAFATLHTARQRVIVRSLDGRPDRAKVAVYAALQGREHVILLLGKDRARELRDKLSTALGD